MTRSTRIIESISSSALLGLILVASPLGASAEEPAPAAISQPAAEESATSQTRPSAAEESASPAISRPAADAPQIEQAAYWRSRGEAARERVADARAVLDEANAAVSRMRRRNHPRGAGRIRLREAQKKARIAHGKAVHYLEVELPAEARAARASQHWLRARTPSGRPPTQGR